MQKIREIKFYTWKDVERCLMLNKNRWEKEILDIEVYLSEIVVVLDSISHHGRAAEILGEIVGDISGDVLTLEMGNSLDIIYEEGEKSPKKDIIAPLFRKALYQDAAYAEDMINENLPGIPVIAFHSYKGGVGRTLAVLAFAKAWSAQEPEGKLLIVDSDIEAPGLSWLWGKEEIAFSYLDLLEMIQSYGKVEEVSALAFDKIHTMTIPVQTELMTVEHFFLPTYRYKEQFLDIYSSPESIANSYNRKYSIAEALSEIGKSLGVRAVLVDLRAGISEFSAPILFDPRVKKYIVTSTSYQSVKGTELLLQQILKGLPVTADIKIPEILLTMVMDNLNTGDLVSDLTAMYEKDGTEEALTDNLVTELPFASELVHLGSLSQIMRCLEEREFYKRIYNIVKDNYTERHFICQENMKDRRKIIENIHRLAENQIHAEGNVKFNILLTQPINNLIKRFENTVPTTVIMGAKGSGKTFLFRELIKGQYWERFVSGLSKKRDLEFHTIVVPLLAARNAGDFQPSIEACIENYNSVWKKGRASLSFCIDNEKKVKRFAKEEHDSIEWLEFWKKLFLPDGYENFLQFDRELSAIGKKVVYVIDGLEEILTQTLTKDREKSAVSALCQDFMNEMRINCKNIGCILFLRKDLARNSIEINFEQFHTLYKGVELIWSRTEALRLVLWLVEQAVPGFYDASAPIEMASPDVIESYLVKLWGRKLGKAESNEAYSSRWIVAALSDFNGQLQARDIIRFLQNATEEAGKDLYDDRYIMPAEIKKAIPKCSLEKISEIKQEIGVLKPVLEKLEKAPSDKKRLPFHSDTFKLSAKEELILKQEGYLRIEADKYYLPEIIRHALEFKYEKGARPKVLSLLLNK